MAKQLAASVALESAGRAQKIKNEIKEKFESQIEAKTIKDGSKLNMSIGVLESDDLNREFDDQSPAFLSLIASLKKNGLIQPITFNYDIASRKFIVVAGHRRLEAARRLKWDKIPAIYSDDSEKRQELRFDENVFREDLNPLDYCKMIKNIQIQYKFNTKELSERLGKSRNAVSSYLKVADWKQEEQNFAKENKIKLTKLVKIGEKKNPIVLQELKSALESQADDNRKKENRTAKKQTEATLIDKNLLTRASEFYTNHSIPNKVKGQLDKILKQYDKALKVDGKIASDFLSVLLKGHEK